MIQVRRDPIHHNLFLFSHYLNIMSTDCPICLESLKNLEKICGEDCGHVICGVCYDHMYKDSKKVKCPVCRIPMVSVNKPANKRALALSVAPVKVIKVAQPKPGCKQSVKKQRSIESDMFLYNFSIGDFDFDY